MTGDNADMTVLLITSSEEDYVADGLFHGLRAMLGAHAIDYPKCERLYEDCPEVSRRRLRGHGFTLYGGELKEIGVDRARIKQRIAEGEIHLVIFGGIWRTYGTFLQWRNLLKPSNCILIDSEDTPQVYANAGLWWRTLHGWVVPQATAGFLYFKREWTKDSQFNLWHRVLPRSMRGVLPAYRGMRTIAISIPESKIVTQPWRKERKFARHVVDREVMAIVGGASDNYVFTREEDYYHELRVSKFAVTTKRAGWDCLRHYEIAANGCVPCFRDLDKKPSTCAPHGLIPDVNCLAYSSAEEIVRKTEELGEDRYCALQHKALEWARANSCGTRARQVLEVWRQSGMAAL